MTVTYGVLTLGVFLAIVLLPWERAPDWALAPFVPGATLAALVEQADQALYRAKSNGRDCLQLVPGPL